jgi:hypothetical protein
VRGVCSAGFGQQSLDHERPSAVVAVLRFYRLRWKRLRGPVRLEPQDDSTPERIFEMRWARTVLERALSRVRSEFDAQERPLTFNR